MEKHAQAEAKDTPGLAKRRARRRNSYDDLLENVLCVAHQTVCPYV
jgi:hypothetical protein